MTQEEARERTGTKRKREYRMKAIKDALVEFVTGVAGEEYTRFLLTDNGCDESEVAALLRSAPKTIEKRRKPKFKGEVLPLDLVGGAYPKNPEAA